MTSQAQPMPDIPATDAQQSATLSADQLCTLTGLTDRRHRQLAAEGYFPPPSNGQYQTTRTIQGMFRYYRELKDRAKGRLNELKELKTEREAERLRLENLKLEGKMVEFDVVNERDAHIGAILKAILYARLNEIGARCAGKSAEELNVFGAQVADEICTSLQDQANEWREQAGI